MFDFAKAIEWCARACSSLFEYKEAKAEHGAEIDIIKTKNNLEKSKNKTKLIIYDCIGLLYKYRTCMTQKDLKNLLKIIKRTKELK